MNQKKIAAIGLIIATVFIAGAAIYIGIRLGTQETTAPTETAAWTGNEQVEVLWYCPGNQASYHWDDAKGTYCMSISTMYGFLAKHWCNTDSWLGGGCNCPSTPQCAPVHHMADGSVYQKGEYTPSGCKCMCDDGSPPYGDVSCRTATADNNCVQNLWQDAGNPPTEVCLDRIRGDRSKTFCGLQQIDFSEADCFLSGAMYNVVECQGEVTQTPTPTLLQCGETGCYSMGGDTDANCEGWTGNPDTSTVECKDGYMEDGVQVGRCEYIRCPEGQVKVGPCECQTIITTPPPQPLTCTGMTYAWVNPYDVRLTATNSGLLTSGHSMRFYYKDQAGDLCDFNLWTRIAQERVTCIIPGYTCTAIQGISIAAPPGMTIPFYANLYLDNNLICTGNPGNDGTGCHREGEGVFPCLSGSTVVCNTSLTISGTPPVTTPPVTTPPVTTPPVTTPPVTTPPVTTPPTTVTTTPPRTATPSTPVTTTPLPPTALVTDEVDRIIIGLMLMFVGFLMYRSGIYINLGNLFWRNGGNKVWKGYKNTNSVFDNTIDLIWDKLLKINNTAEAAVNKTGRFLGVIPKGIGRMLTAAGKKLTSPRSADLKADFEERVISERDQDMP